MITGRATAHQRRVSGLVQARRDGRADRTRSHDRNAYAHLSHATAWPLIQKYSRTMHSRSFGAEAVRAAVPARSVSKKSREACRGDGDRSSRALR